MVSRPTQMGLFLLPHRKTKTAYPMTQLDFDTTASTNTKPHILIIEDDHVSQIMMAEMVNRMGYISTVAGDGLHALVLLSTALSENWMYDLVLTDLDMPRMDGFITAQSIRVLGLTSANLPIVAVSIDDGSQTIARGKAAGIQDHIAKPVMMDELRNTLHKWAGPEAARGAAL